jgi:hypothetical protein
LLVLINKEEIFFHSLSEENLKSHVLLGVPFVEGTYLYNVIRGYMRFLLEKYHGEIWKIIDIQDK